MRIAVNGWFQDQLSTGSGQYLAALAEWLPRVGEGHEFIVIESRSSIAAKQRRSASPFAVRRSLTRSLAKLWFEQVTFPRACRRLRAQVAFVPYWGSPWFSPCPVVVTIHDLIPLLLPQYRGDPLQRVYTWLVSRTARRAAAVLTDSEASKRDIVAHLSIPDGRIRAVHLAVAPCFRPVTDPVELARVRARYSLPAAPFLLYLGGFDVRKNIARMIEAYARVVGRAMEADGLSSIGSRPPALVIAGKLPEGDTGFAPDPRRVVAELGIQDQVHFAGWVDEADKPALYSLARATVFVSEYEGFGLPVLEAMACG